MSDDLLKKAIDLNNQDKYFEVIELLNEQDLKQKTFQTQP